MLITTPQVPLSSALQKPRTSLPLSPPLSPRVLVQAHWIKGGDLDREGSGDDHGEKTASDGGADPEAHRSYRPASSPTDTVPHRHGPPDPRLQVGEGRADVGEGTGDPSREGIHSDEDALEEEGGCGRGRVCRTPVLVASKD